MSVKRINTSDDSHIIWGPTDDTIEPETENIDIHSKADIKRLNADAMSSYAEREAQQVVGTSQVAAAAKEARRQGSTPPEHAGVITAELVGDVGDEITETVRLDLVAKAAKALHHRIAEERAEMEAEWKQEAREKRADELLADAWEVAGKRKAVPEIFGPLTEFLDRRVSEDALYSHLWLTERIDSQHADRAQQAVIEHLDELHEIIERHSSEAIDQAQRAIDMLASEGLRPNVELAEIIDSGSVETLDAIREWRHARKAWGEAHSARLWVAVASEIGFDPKSPEKLIQDERRRTGSFALNDQTFPRADLEARISEEAPKLPA
ncbi:hypothetical protein [Rhodococcus globerulus]|uniref:hypothetical protein n=1 Tax=Rhodococcus globerulus TaxID=33008 RepID=UPI000B1765D5|nr:hypothetical protein [Rhodococcus globerulus]